MTYQAPSGPPAGYYPQPPQPPTNTMAIIAIIAALIFPPAGIVCGIIARKQIKQTGERGDGLALAGIVISSVYIVLGILSLISVVALFAIADVPTPP